MLSAMVLSSSMDLSMTCELLELVCAHRPLGPDGLDWARDGEAKGPSVIYTYMQVMIIHM